ncbi:MAG TPA: YetF domain-containing protein [Candidatus Nanoarchaeia archaeon]|nr:YetF domain-containing protein [Candidatus Nanoarchaeia archaeon]
MELVTFPEFGSIVIRTVSIFLFTFIVMRSRGNKQLAQLNLFDIIIIIALGSAVGDVIIYNENYAPLVKSMIGIATLILLVLFIENILAILPKSWIKVIEGKEEIIVKDGRVDYSALKKVNIHEEELKSKLRLKNIHSYKAIKRAYLEPDGSISIIRKNDVTSDDDF